jgi:hypothetical protein
MRKDIIILLKQSIYICVILGWVTQEKINQFPVYVRQYTQYTMYVYCREIYNLFVRAFETSRKASMWRSSQTCSTASTNKYLF